MRINEKMKIRSVADEHIVIMPDGEKTDMTKVVALNESALLLYNTLRGKEFTLDDAVRVLTNEYSVDETNARRDAETWIMEMKQNGLLV